MGKLFKPISCSCAACQRMCASSVCLPTPKEVERLKAEGYGDRLGEYVFSSGPVSVRVIAPATVGKEGQTLHNTNQGACTFRTPDGRCELHCKALKPLEGRIARHDRPWQVVRMQALQHWLPEMTRLA